MLRSESGNATVYGVTLILLALLLLWLFTGLSPGDVVTELWHGTGGMATEEQHKIEGNTSPDPGVSNFGQNLSGAFGGRP